MLIELYIPLIDKTPEGTMLKLFGLKEGQGLFQNFLCFWVSRINESHIITYVSMVSAFWLPSLVCIPASPKSDTSFSGLPPSFAVFDCV